VTTEIKTNAMGGGIAAAGTLTPNVPATARLGAARVKAKGTGSSGAISFSESDTTTQAYFGLDIGYAFSKAAVVTLSADFSRSEISGDTGSVRLIGVGFTFNF
jgi:hypothetical protein